MTVTSHFCARIRSGSSPPSLSSTSERKKTFPSFSLNSRSDMLCVGKFAIHVRAMRFHCNCQVSSHMVLAACGHNCERRAEWSAIKGAVVFALSCACVPLARVLPRHQEITRRLELSKWLVAWSRYTLAAVITEQMTHCEAVQHASIVSEVCGFICRSTCTHFRLQLYHRWRPWHRPRVEGSS